MKTLSQVGTRRDRCHLVGKRARRLSIRQGAMAWMHISDSIEMLGDKDLPKFDDLLSAIRSATIKAKYRIHP